MEPTDPPRVPFGITEPDDGDWHSSKLGEAELSDLITRRHGQRPKQVAWVKQVHGDRVLTVDGSFRSGQEADALVTTTPGVALTVGVADCAPVMIDAGSAVGIAHAGMAGALAGVVPRILERLAELSGTPPREWRVALGPHICARCYAVSPNNRDLLDGYPESDRYIRRVKDRDTFDLASVIEDQLAAAGVARVETDGRCTYHDGLFSARRGSGDQRQRAYIFLPHA